MGTVAPGWLFPININARQEILIQEENTNLHFRKDSRRDCYLAEFYCQYASCAVQANVEICCKTNNVNLKFFTRRDRFWKRPEKKKNKMDAHIIFKAHEPEKIGEKQQVVQFWTVESCYCNILNLLSMSSYF